jgi:hypothetical protein
MGDPWVPGRTRWSWGPWVGVWARRLVVTLVGRVLRRTGLPSRSTPGASPLRLAALRWRAAFIALGRSRPLLGVSTAFLVAVTRFSVTPIPGEPHTALCPSKLERWRHNTVYCTPAVARRLVLSGARDSRASRSPKSGESATWGARGPRDAEPVISPVALRAPACRIVFSDDWLRHARYGEACNGGEGGGCLGEAGQRRPRRDITREPSDSSSPPRTAHRPQRRPIAPTDKSLPLRFSEPQVSSSELDRTVLRF